MLYFETNRENGVYCFYDFGICDMHVAQCGQVVLPAAKVVCQEIQENDGTEEPCPEREQAE